MSLEDSMTMMFMVPKKFKRNASNLINPIKFREEPAKLLLPSALVGLLMKNRKVQNRNKISF
jgi:hypothetical protein